MKAVDLVLAEPVPLIGHFVGGHVGVFQQLADIDMAIAFFDQLDIAVDDPAVVQRDIVPSIDFGHARAGRLAAG